MWPVTKNKTVKLELSSYFQLLTHLGPSTDIQGAVLSVVQLPNLTFDA